jgi:hypothetical protein
LIETLRKVLDDAALAAALNRERIRATGGQTWTRQRVQRYRQHAGIAGFDAALKEASGWLTQSETATRLNISPMSVHRLVGSGILAAEQPHRGLPMVISASDLRHEEVERAVLALKSGHPRPLPDDPRQTKFLSARQLVRQDGGGRPFEPDGAAPAGRLPRTNWRAPTLFSRVFARDGPPRPQECSDNLRLIVTRFVVNST